MSNAALFKDLRELALGIVGDNQADDIQAAKVLALLYIGDALHQLATPSDEGQQAQCWKYGITHASPDEIELNEYFTPLYPNPQNEWELISMGVGRERLFFLWRASAGPDEGQQGEEQCRP